MRKYTLFTILLLCLAARGQTITDLTDIDLSGLPQPTTAKALRYWFDYDAVSQQTISDLTGTYTLDVRSLTDGLHTLHFQVIEDNDAVGDIRSCVFLKHNQQQSMVTAQSLCYWFDDDKAIATTTSQLNGLQTLDVSTLTDGLHTIHYQVFGSDAVSGDIASGLFMKFDSKPSADNLTASKLLYWFDDNSEIQTVDMGNGVLLLDASSLEEGLHTIHYQVLCNNGQMTPANSSIFLHMNSNAETAVAQSLRYWFDDEQTVTETQIAESVKLLDAAYLTDGLHTVHYQIKDHRGALGAPVSSIFLKMNEQGAMSKAKSIRYWFDEDVSSIKVSDVSNGTQTLDVSDIMIGLHTLNYQLIDNNGKESSPMACIFLKSNDKVIEGDENSITKYEYWMNDNSKEMQTVTVNGTSNPYTLIGLLPMQKEPIKSDLFHFEFTDGSPNIYAKNIFNIRFHDALGYFSDSSKPFIDYSVKQVVEPLGELQKSQTFAKVTENDILWYTVQLMPGDTVALCVSQPTTLQLFAPSGEEVFRTSESASMQWDGTHVWKEGTYYLAVHDVTGSQSSMTLDYLHMDKYDVVDWDVHTVGNGGCSTITFKGNGFRDLYAVDLFNAAGDSIHSVYISHESDAETSVVFDFNGAELVEYDAVFRFTDEVKVFTNVITVEEAIDIELATDVSFPSSFLRGTSTTYTIKIMNKGNMTAYAVPININIAIDNPSSIQHLSIKGLDLPSIFSGINKDSLSAEEKHEMDELANEIGESHYFIGRRLFNDATGDSQYVQIAMLFTDIAPNTTKVITLSIKSTSSITVISSVPKDYFACTIKDTQFESSPKRIRKRTMKEQYCCIRNKVECVANIIADAASLTDLVLSLDPTASAHTVAAIVDCVAGIIKQTVRACGVVFCDDNSVEANFYEKLKYVIDNISLGGTIATCASNFIPGSKLINAIGNGSAAFTNLFIGGIAIDGADCLMSLFTKVPNCPPNPDGGGGTSTPYEPRDPNDIYGYLSESGSKFIADSVARVNYTIEFENDTAFATAPAHTIVVKDTLDKRYFDLEKFMPTGVRIGSKEEHLSESDIYTNNGRMSFVKTIDMRPEIYAIAQVEGDYDHAQGIATWTFTSLDPMSMEPTDELMQGILPVNWDGTSGIGEVMFEVGVKPNKGDGTEVRNRAGIVFDYEEPIITPTWTNTVDAVAPTSCIEGAIHAKTDTLTLRLKGEDNRSGIWRYNVYAQYGKGTSWELVKENVAVNSTEGETETLADVRIYDGIDHGFCVLATDSAGNVERKEFTREFEFYSVPEYTQGDVNSDGKLDTQDAIKVIQYYLGKKPENFDAEAADVNGDGNIDTQDAIQIIRRYLKK